VSVTLVSRFLLFCAALQQGLSPGMRNDICQLPTVGTANVYSWTIGAA
jgi:hypothetical protein